MEATAILAILDGALTILEKAAPWVAQAVNSGSITPAQQQQLYNRVQALQNPGTAFQGPEWTPSAGPVRPAD
jgi:hypothetical protein